MEGKLRFRSQSRSLSVGNNNNITNRVLFGREISLSGSSALDSCNPEYGLCV